MLAQSQGQLMSDHERIRSGQEHDEDKVFSPPRPFSLSLTVCSLPSRVTFVHSMVSAVRHREALGPCEVIPSRFCSGRDVHLLRGAESTTEVRHDAESPIKDLDPPERPPRGARPSRLGSPAPSLLRLPLPSPSR